MTTDQLTPEQLERLERIEVRLSHLEEIIEEKLRGFQREEGATDR